MEIFNFDDIEPIKILKNGGLIAFPTETVFGIGARFDNDNSYKRLVSIKNRPAQKPFTIMLGDKKFIRNYATISKKQEKIIEKFMPGKLTVILKKRLDLPDYFSLKGDTIGIRVPGDEKLRNFLLKVGVPLMVPSANKSGENPARNVKEIIKQFDGELDGVIDGKTENGISSTVVSLVNDKIILLREGEIKEEDLKEFFNED